MWIIWINFGLNVCNLQNHSWNVKIIMQYKCKGATEKHKSVLWAQLGACMAQLGACMAQLGACMAQLGACMAQLGACMAQLGACMAQLGACMAQLGACMAQLGEHTQIIIAILKIKSSTAEHGDILPNSAIRIVAIQLHWLHFVIFFPLLIHWTGVIIIRRHSGSVPTWGRERRRGKVVQLRR